MVEEIESFFEFSGRTIGAGALQDAYYNVGKFGEYLDKVESSKPGYNHLHLSLETFTDPNFRDRLTSEAHRLAKSVQDNFLLAQLWYLYIATNDSEKALDLERQYPSLMEYLERNRIAPKIKRAFNREILDQVLRFTDNVEIRRKALVCTVFELFERKDLKAAQECLDLARKIGIDTSRIPPRILSELNVAPPASDDDVTESRRQESEARSA
ncbi:uncharacterized protein LOC100898843 [Galendromus occidentalis]|uniref:Uncharacterized protein LOC100898843 n=1 Tax=Galendromus occidentalis TaxID=34638 RepID=A0AAJ7P9S3_9ACAR|nr:uncharacterized protein LOC100898843 [Galendromus occidentalis]